MGFFSEFINYITGSEEPVGEQLQSLVAYQAAKEVNPDIEEPSWYSEGNWIHDLWEGSTVQSLVSGLMGWLAQGLPNSIADRFELGEIPKIAKAAEAFSATNIGTTVEKLVSANSSADIASIDDAVLYKGVLEAAKEHIEAPIGGWRRIGRSILGDGNLEKQALKISENVYEATHKAAEETLIVNYLNAKGISFRPSAERMDQLLNNYPEISRWATSVAQEVSGVRMEQNANGRSVFVPNGNGVHQDILDGEDVSISFSGTIQTPPTAQLDGFAAAVQAEKVALERMAATPFTESPLSKEAHNHILDLAIAGATTVGATDATAFTVAEQEGIAGLKTTNPALYQALEDQLEIAGNNIHSSILSADDIDLVRNSDGLITQVIIQNANKGDTLVSAPGM